MSNGREYTVARGTGWSFHADGSMRLPVFAARGERWLTVRPSDTVTVRSWWSHALGRVVTAEEHERNEAYIAELLGK